MQELSELRMRDASYRDHREKWSDEKKELTRSLQMLQQENASALKEKEEARRHSKDLAKDLRRKVIEINEQKQQNTEELKLREQRIYELEAENGRFRDELQRFRNSSRKQLKEDLTRKDNYINHLQALMSELEQKNVKLRTECDGLRRDVEQQRQHYVTGPAPNTPHLIQPQKKIKQIKKVAPAAPAPKAFPGRKTWSPKKSQRIASKSVQKAARVNSLPARVVKRPTPTIEKPGVNNLAPRVLERASSGISFESLASGDWQTSKNTAKNPNTKQKSLDEKFGNKNPFDFTGEHNKKKKKKKKKSK